MSNGCKDCQERFVGCHSVCRMYIAFRKDLDRKKNLKDPGEDDYYDYLYKSVARTTGHKPKEV